MRGIHKILSAVVTFGVLLSAGAGEAADLRYRVRKRLCSDTFCPLENELMAFLYPSFIDATGQLAGDEVISNAIEVLEHYGTARVWVDGDPSARIRVNGGAWQTIVDARNGDSVELKLVASAIPGRMVGATANVGTRSEAWHVTTAGGIPVTFSPTFAEKINQDLGVNVTSNEVVISYSGETLTATISGGQDACVIVNWVGSCLASQQVSSGDTLQSRVKTPSTPGTREMSRITVGASYADWYVKTAGEAGVDYSGNFTPLSGQLENDLVVSNAITAIGGFEGSVSATASGDGSPELSVNGGGWTTTAPVVRNDTVRLRMTTAPTQNTSATARLTAGGSDALWNTETGSPTVSFSGDFTDLSNQDKNVQVSSADVTVSGISGTLTATASGEGTPQISTDGGLTWGTTADVGDGATIRLHMMTASTSGTTRTAKVSIGSTYRDWQVSTTHVGCDGGPWTSCQAAYDGGNTTDGLCILQPPGIATPFETYCRMSFDGGGWTMVATMNPWHPNANWPTAANINPATIGNWRVTDDVYTALLDQATVGFLFEGSGNAYFKVAKAPALSANCVNMTHLRGTQTGCGSYHDGYAFAWNEASGCTCTGLDYTVVHVGTYYNTMSAWNWNTSKYVYEWPRSGPWRLGANQAGKYSTTFFHIYMK